MAKKKEEKDWVKEALALASPLRKLDKKVVDAELVKARAARKGLLGIERNAAHAIDARIMELEGEKAGVGYQRLSVEPLRWRDSKGMPRLVLYSISSPEAKFSFDGDDLSVPGPDSFNRSRLYEDDEEAVAEAAQEAATQPWADVYSDIFHKLDKEFKASSMDTIEYKTIFDGLLPAEVREIAKREKKKFDGLYILAEVKEWKKNVIAKPKYADPLLVGWKEPNFFVLAAFDLTPTEEYVRREFCT